MVLGEIPLTYPRMPTRYIDRAMIKDTSLVSLPVYQARLYLPMTWSGLKGYTDPLGCRYPRSPKNGFQNMTRPDSPILGHMHPHHKRLLHSIAWPNFDISLSGMQIKKMWHRFTMSPWLARQTDSRQSTDQGLFLSTCQWCEQWCCQKARSGVSAFSMILTLWTFGI